MFEQTSGVLIAEVDNTASHHPPVTASYVTNKTRGVTVSHLSVHYYIKPL